MLRKPFQIRPRNTLRLARSEHHERADDDQHLPADPFRVEPGEGQLADDRKFGKPRGFFGGFLDRLLDQPADDHEFAVLPDRGGDQPLHADVLRDEILLLGSAAGGSAGVGTFPLAAERGVFLKQPKRDRPVGVDLGGEQQRGADLAARRVDLPADVRLEGARRDFGVGDGLLGFFHHGHFVADEERGAFVVADDQVRRGETGDAPVFFQHLDAGAEVVGDRVEDRRL
ncbi:hypothetical protein SDC9_123123 [bioreactor metagenome]|uniref:Uncharacterized protein n=1 Tax=bioreactor metagenome TaxID=1076179 RepID=A0A645CGX1_9ZZZZ